jgi:hypothetical protein
MALIRLDINNPDATNEYLEKLTGRPVGTPPAFAADDINRLGEVIQGNFSYLSAEASVKLGFGFGSFEGSTGRKVMVFEYAATMVKDDPHKTENGIASWTYGAGYRIGILLFDTQVQAQLSFAAIAASATLEIKKAQIHILGYGVPSGPTIPFPDVSNFDVQAYGKFIKWQQDVIDYINANKKDLTPIRIYAALTVDIEKYFESTAPLRYALRRLQDKNTLNEALTLAIRNSIPHVLGHDSEIRAVYAKITGYADYLYGGDIVDKQSISDTAKKKAEEWIAEYDKV